MAALLAETPARPIVKWAGGKARLLPALRAALPSRWSGRYFEPFCGGAALFFDQCPRRAVLGDVNARLINLYIEVRRDHRAVFAELDRLAHARGVAQEEAAAHYYAVRTAFNDAHPTGARQAARFLYLNKAGYNGLYRENRAGRYNVPAGRPSGRSRPLASPLVEAELARAAASLAHVDLRASDYRATVSDARAGDVVYFDPPYLPRRSRGFTAYSSEAFGPHEHAELADVAAALSLRGCHVVVSNHDLPAVRSLYPSFSARTVEVVRSVSCKRRGRVPEIVLVAPSNTGAP